MTQALPKEFTHYSVLSKEAVDSVVTDPDGIYVDATFGRGGHSRKILQRLSQKGRLIAFDRDPEAIAVGKQIDDPRFCIIKTCFSEMRQALTQCNVLSVSGVLMDIGVSSPQIDDPERGFSFRMDGPLDMRMDPQSGMSAAQWLAVAREAEIAEVIRTYGEERFAGKIARQIVSVRQSEPLLRTRDLANLVAGVIPRSRQDPTQHPATRTFQAIRIHVNGELDELRSALDAAGGLLREGARLSVISFHSLEDRVVKRFFEAGAHPEREISSRIALRESDLPKPFWTDVCRQRASAQECDENPRSRSAVLRFATRTGRDWCEFGGDR